MASGEDETLYCICREPYDGQRFMIECDKCSDWFHGSCVDIKEHQAADIETYHCPDCQIKHGPLVLKRKRNMQRRDYSESDDNIDKIIQTGTVKFISNLKGRSFPSAEEVMAYLTDGYELDAEFLDETEFHYPIIVFNREGLDLKVPPSSFTIQDVENHIGSMREIDVIDCQKQQDCKMLMREWTEYYTSSVRQKVLNVISLEFSKSRLSELVEPPRIVRELSWVNNYWPKTADSVGDVEYEKPSVQKYCLMSIKDSYTDFHIDFGGTSVWYHVLRGEKVFYLIEPTAINLQLYQVWITSSNQSQVFFGDQVKTCYKCVVKQGQTMFIPTGWIHAVLTPIDSLVFGGNFLQKYNMPLQIQVYEIEKRTGAASKYLFPNYETLHWYAAQGFLKTCQGFSRLKKELPHHLAVGIKALVTALRDWTHKRDYIKRDNIPDSIQYGKLLKELEKELRHLTKPKDWRKKKRLDKKDLKSDIEDSCDATSSQSDLDVEVKDEKPDLYQDDKSKNTVGEMLRQMTKAETKPHNKSPKRESSPRSLIRSPRSHGNTPPRPLIRSPPDSPHRPLIRSPPSQTSASSSPHRPLIRSPPESNTPLIRHPPSQMTPPRSSSKSPRASDKLSKNGHESSSSKSDSGRSRDNEKLSHKSSSPRRPSALGSPPSGSAAAAKLTFRLPKSGNADVSSRNSQSSDLSVYDFGDDDKTATSATESDLDLDSSSSRSRLKSESSGGGGDLFSPPKKLTLKLGASASSTRPGAGGDASRTVSTSQEEDEEDVSSQGGSDDSETEQLVVDETPKKRRKMAHASPPQHQQQQLKFRYSVNKSSHDPAGMDSSQDSSYSDIDVVGDSSSSPLKPFSPQHGGVISRHDEYGIQHSYEDRLSDSSPPITPSRQSGSMQVQAMLNMRHLSAATTSTLQSSSKNSPFRLDKAKAKATLRLERESKNRSLLAEGSMGERLSTAYKDDEYIYPTLAESDDEQAAGKPKAKQERDDAWNPRGRVTSSMPKKERQPRYGARKESLECQLEDAAAKLANKPMPKAHYVKRKHKPERSTSQSDPYHQSSSSSNLTYEHRSSSPGPLYMDYDGPSTSSHSTNRSHQSQPSSSSHMQQVKKAPSAKKGSTAKQRLGKILGMHKMGLF